MKLGEALAEKKRLQSDLSRINELMGDSFFHKKDDLPDFDFKKLRKEQKRLLKNILNLKLAIQKTNELTNVNCNGERLTIQQLIIKLGDIRSEISVLNGLYSKRDRLFRYEDDEKEKVSQIPLNDLQSDIRNLGKLKTEMDSLLQHKNWTTELIDS